MIKAIFTALMLVVLCSCTHVEDNQKQAEDLVAKVAKKKVLGEWDTYDFYTGPATFLTNAGFSGKAYCAIAYRRSYSHEGNDFAKHAKAFDKQDLVLKEVVEDGIKLLKEVSAFSTLSHDEAKEKVYINLNSTMATLGLYISAAIKASKDENIKQEDLYRKLYLNTDCELLIGHNLD